MDNESTTALGMMGNIGGEVTKYSPRKKTLNGPTIRSIEKLKKENVNAKRKEAKAFELDLLTAPGKPLRSVPKLQEALNEFFDKHKSDPYITINELAIAVGYADADALSKALYDESTPRYTALLRRAYSLVDDLMTKRMLHLADLRHDVKGYQAALERMDKKRDKYDPALDQSNTSVSIAINMKESEEIKGLVSDRISALLGSQKSAAIDVVPRPAKEPVLIPARIEEVKE